MDLAGWDLVFSVEVDAFNRMLARSQSPLLRSFNLTDHIIANGTYGKWQIAPGGSGNILILALTIAQGSLENGPSSIRLDGSVLSVRVAVQQVPPQTGRSFQLDFGSAPVIFVGFEGVEGVGEVLATALGEALAADLALRAADIGYVLASVSQVRDGWLNPAQIDFAYAVPVGGRPHLAIFATTATRDISGLDRTVDPAVTSAEEIGMAMTPALFLGNILAPALAAGLRAPSGAIVLNGPMTLGNVQSIYLPPVYDAGETYRPVVNAFSATLRDDRIAIDMRGSCDMGMNMKVTFTASSTVGVALRTGGVLALTTLGRPNFTHDASIPWYDHLLDIIGAAATIIFEVTVAVISKELGNDIGLVAASSDVTKVAPDIVSWTNGGEFSPSEAGLADAFWLRGKLDEPNAD